jgi:hypothetical protein
MNEKNREENENIQHEQDDKEEALEKAEKALSVKLLIRTGIKSGQAAVAISDKEWME